LTYRIEIKRAAEKDMRSLPDNVLRRVNRAVVSLGDDPRGRGTKKLVGGRGFAARVGQYRLIYGIDDEARIVDIRAVRHRREAYR